MRKTKILVIIIIILLVVSNFSSLVFAEVVVFKSGQKIQGKIIEKTDKYIKIDFEGVSLTYYLNEIESIDGKMPTQSLSIKEELSAQTIDKTDDNIITSNVYKRQSDIYLAEGWKYFKNEQYQQAVEKLQECIQIDPNYAECFLVLGAAYNSLGQVKESRNNLQKAKELFQQKRDKKDYDYEMIRKIEESLGNLVNQGQLFLEEGDYDNAIKTFEEVIRAEPKNALAWSSLGMAYGQGRNDWSKGVKYCLKATQLEPNAPYWHGALGIAYVSKGNKQSALKEADILEKLNNSDLANMLRLYAIAIRPDKPVKIDLDDAMKSGRKMMEIVEEMDKRDYQERKEKEERERKRSE